MTSKTRDDESLACACIQRATGANVGHHDDQSSDAMFDLAIYDDERRLIGAVEVTTVVDEQVLGGEPGDLLAVELVARLESLARASSWAGLWLIYLGSRVPNS